MNHPLTVYKASAGSGKTFRLAVEYIKLLVLAEDGGEYAHILAVTFTNKATSEMKDRIISQLYGIGHDLSSSRPYLEALRLALTEEDGAPADDAEIRRRCLRSLRLILHDYNHFRVETIDSFFQSILRGLAHELGLTANLQVEINDKEVLSEAVDRIIDRLQQEPVVLDWLLSLVRDQIDNNQRWDVTGRVKDFGQAIFNEDFLRRGDRLRQVLSNGEQVQQFMKQLRQTQSDAIARVRDLGRRIDEEFAAAGLAYGDFSNGQRILSALVGKLRGGDIRELELSDTVQQWAADPLTMLKKADRQRPEMLDAADAVSGLLAELAEQLPQLQYAVNSATLALAHIKPLFLLDFIDREVAHINSETSRFNLAKTPILLSRMIGESDAPFIFEKIGAQLHHVMIDEFQDTSRLQWENFRTLLLESYSRGGRNLIVGDVKQSIYRWRGGDWRILGDIGRTMSPPPIMKALDTNHRSLRRIVDFNSEFFSLARGMMEQISQEEEQQLGLPDFFLRAYEDVVQRVPERRGQEGYVRVRVLDSEQHRRREDWEPLVLEDMCGQIRRLHGAGLPYNDMAILVRNNYEIESIVQAFAELEDMPPIVSDEAFLLRACKPVVLLVEALRCLQEESPVARFFLEENGVDVQWLDAGRDALLMTPLYELLELLFRQFRLDLYTGQDAFFFGFFDAVGDFLHTDNPDLTTFLAFWDERLSRQSVPAGEVDGIRILTVHKSKGLEFHTVLLPFCAWDFERDRPDSLIWCTPTDEPYAQMQLLPVTPSSKTTPKSAFARDYAETHLLSRMDELNALYVAFTRASANLILWSVGSDLQRKGRTVGDLVACVAPDMLQEVEPGLYESGIPVVAVAQHHTDGQNRMALPAAPLPVVMRSFDLSVTFRQSNQSAQFISEQSGAQELPPEEQTQRHYLETGRLLHRVLQSIRTEADVDAVLDHFERQGLISRTAADGTHVAVPRAAMQRWVAQGLRNPMVSDWFQPRWQLFNECSIVSLAADGTPEVHRPDRVMISEDGKRIVVVDFKFGSMRQEYNQQVQEYMQLLRSMSPGAKVEGYLWFVYTGRVQCVGEATGSAADSNQLTLEF